MTYRELNLLFREISTFQMTVMHEKTVCVCVGVCVCVCVCVCVHCEGASEHGSADKNVAQLDLIQHTGHMDLTHTHTRTHTHSHSHTHNPSKAELHSAERFCCSLFPLILSGLNLSIKLKLVSSSSSSSSSSFLRGRE